MLFKAKHLQLGVVSAIFSCASFSVLAAPTVCTVVPTGTTYNATIAVASNFYGPAQDLVTDFTGVGKPGAGKKIRICQNSTATLDSEIRTGTSGYSLFLAANASTPNALVGTTYVQSGATSDLYAKGVPVIFARSAAGLTAGDIIAGQGTGQSATISTPVTSAQAINTSNVQAVAVANPSLAPYGLAASTILNAMGLWNGAAPIPAWMHSPLYDNIDLTFDSVTVTPFPNKSGFVSKAQICSIRSSVTHIEFTAYLLDQKGILINSGNATQNSLAASLKSFMLSNPSPTYWPTFLTSHCYSTI